MSEPKNRYQVYRLINEVWSVIKGRIKTGTRPFDEILLGMHIEEERRHRKVNGPDSYPKSFTTPLAAKALSVHDIAQALRMKALGRPVQIDSLLVCRASYVWSAAVAYEFAAGILLDLETMGITLDQLITEIDYARLASKSFN